MPDGGGVLLALSQRLQRERGKRDIVAACVIDQLLVRVLGVGNLHRRVQECRDLQRVGGVGGGHVRVVDLLGQRVDVRRLRGRGGRWPGGGRRGGDRYRPGPGGKPFLALPQDDVDDEGDGGQNAGDIHRYVLDGAVIVVAVASCACDGASLSCSFSPPAAPRLPTRH